MSQLSLDMHEKLGKFSSPLVG